MSQVTPEQIAKLEEMIAQYKAAQQPAPVAPPAPAVDPLVESMAQRLHEAERRIKTSGVNNNGAALVAQLREAAMKKYGMM